MSETLKLFQLCCGHIRLLLKKLHGYTNIHVKSFLFIETGEGINNHLKIEYIVFGDDGSAVHGASMFNSKQLKEQYVPEVMFKNYSDRIK